MTKGFWTNLAKPIFALAPMYDVTDAAFRKVIAKHGKPDLFFTEFVSTDGLQSDGRAKLLHHLLFSKEEQPIVAQVFGTKPDKFQATPELVQSLGFSGIDINMGCPDKNIIKTGSCAGLFNNQDLAQSLIKACQIGAPNIPTSVKIRIGDSKIDWKPWIANLLEANPAVITIHLRTRKEMSKVPAHWELMPEIMEFVKENTELNNRPLIIGNGDVTNLVEAQGKVDQTGCDGVMIGRGIFGNPWLFSKPIHIPSTKEKVQALLEHTKLYDEIFIPNIKSFDVMKRHFKAYINGFDGAAELRAQLYESKNYNDVAKILTNFLATI